MCFTAGSDYNHTNTSLTFNGSMTLHSVQVPILQEGFLEETEQFHVSLTLVNDNGIFVNVNPATAIVNITDGRGEL